MKNTVRVLSHSFRHSGATLKAIVALVIATGFSVPAIHAAAAPVDLTAYLKANPALGANYQYFALGLINDSYNGITAVTPLTVPFLPGWGASNLWEANFKSNSSVTVDANQSNHLVFDNSVAVSAGAIPFNRGKLTDGGVGGDIGRFGGALSLASGTFTNNPVGSFHILLDLGAAYNLTEINIAWRESSGSRWNENDVQKVFTATSLDDGVAGFTLLGSNTFDRDGKDKVQGTAVFDATEGGIVARYVLLEITARVNYGTTPTNTAGGFLTEITILASSTTPIPEPAKTASVLGGLGALAAAACIVLRRR
ncbi:MAG: hypothetical protein LBK99_22025 [Opitutaceae bacterium]|nr:hypothetical protein [Opitutaceae bacterium]